MTREEYEKKKFEDAVERNVGQKKLNYQGCEMEIIEYIDHQHVKVRFNDEYNYTVTVQPIRFKNGSITNNFYPTLYGVGMLGNAETSLGNNVKKPSYLCWKGMMARCYDPNGREMYKYYNDCSVCDEWHIFENFEKWYNENYYEIPNCFRMCLDKDILVKGNKTYSPQTCAFVPYDINIVFTKNKARRGDMPIGVFYNPRKKHKYQALCRFYGKQKIIGQFDTVDDAFVCYKQAKENYIKELADKYEEYIPHKIYEAMYNYEVEITD